MEMFAILFGGICLIFAVIFLVSESEFIFEVKVGLILALLFQLFWFPQTFDTKIDTETYITNKHENYVFEQSVKITKTRTYKPLSAVTDDTVYTIEFIKE